MLEASLVLRIVMLDENVSKITMTTCCVVVNAWKPPQSSDIGRKGDEVISRLSDKYCFSFT